MATPDFSLTISERRPTCVIDPALALASREAPLIMARLAKLLDLWVPRAFWQLLDASDFIEKKASLMKTSKEPVASEKEHEWMQEYCDTIKIWQSLRSRRDMTGLGLRWLGDKLEESLGPDADWEALLRYEALADSINRRQPNPDEIDPLSLEYASSDALALAAAIGSRFILALAGSNTEAEPICCQAMSAGKVPVKRIDLSEPSELVKREREQICDLLAWGGASMWSFKNMAIALVQVVAPRIWETSMCSQAPIIPEDLVLTSEQSKLTNDTTYCDYWTNAAVFWYHLE